MKFDLISFVAGIVASFVISAIACVILIWLATRKPRTDAKNTPPIPSRPEHVSNHESPPAMDFNAGILMDQVFPPLPEESPEKVFLDVTESPDDWAIGRRVFTRRAEYEVIHKWENNGKRRVELHKIPGTELPSPPDGEDGVPLAPGSTY